MTQPAALRIAGDTHVGKVRETNEDSMIVDHQLGLYVVLDGMGGANAGDVASQTARDAIRDFVAQRKKAMEPRALLEAAIQYGSAAVWNAAHQSRERHGMGTTVVACLVLNSSRLVIAHVGDSRAYLFRDRRLIALTRDHSLVEDLLAKGQIGPDEALVHPQRHILLRALGIEGQMEPDIISKDIQSDDVLLLCTDGITKMLSEQQIGDCLRLTSQTPEEACDRLIKEANASGGKDNSTAAVIRFF